VHLWYVQLIPNKPNAADSSSGVFTILFSVTQTEKIQDSLPFHKFCQNLANSNVTQEAFNYSASLSQMTALLMPLVSSGI